MFGKAPLKQEWHLLPQSEVPTFQIMQLSHWQLQQTPLSPQYNVFHTTAHQVISACVVYASACSLTELEPADTQMRNCACLKVREEGIGLAGLNE